MIVPLARNIQREMLLVMVGAKRARCQRTPVLKPKGAQVGVCWLDALHTFTFKKSFWLRYQHGTQEIMVQFLAFPQVS